MAELSEAAEVVEEVVETVAEGGLSSREIRFLLGGVGVGLLGGAVVATLVTRRRVEAKYMQLAEAEIQDMRVHFEAKTRAGVPKPELDEVVKDLGYSAPNIPKTEEIEDDLANVVEETTQEEVEKVIDEEVLKVAKELEEDTTRDPEDGWDYRVEIASRRPDKPYIINVNELHETDYTETSLIYFTSDDVLCDTDDSVIGDKEGVIGEDNLEKFGHGSGDKNILFIRNDSLGVDMEIVKNNGNYAEVVHGFQHSDTPVRRRRRTVDDEW